MTYGARVIIVREHDHQRGLVGTVVSGPNETRLLRVRLDEKNCLGHPVYRYLFRPEVELVDAGQQETVSPRPEEAGPGPVHRPMDSGELVSGSRDDKEG